MSGPWPGILLAIVASVALNGSFVLQHAGSAEAPAVDVRRPAAAVIALLRSPVWALGAVVGMAGWALHVGALARAPVSLVQAFIAGGVALTVPMSVFGLGRRVSAGEASAAALMVGALVLLTLGQHDAGRTAAAPPSALGPALIGLGALAGLLALRGRGHRRAAALGISGGLLYGGADLAIKAMTAVHAAHGLGPALLSPWLPAALACSAGAFFTFQRGLQIGPPVTVIALMTAATDVTAVLGGLGLLGDPLGRTPVLVAAHVAGFVLVVLAGWALAPAQAPPAPVRSVEPALRMRQS
jgi:drug/metabolite transporter (DMT)-like permease